MGCGCMGTSSDAVSDVNSQVVQEALERDIMNFLGLNVFSLILGLVAGYFVLPMILGR